jgi:ribulose-5-phosphate 4-epimerase/fuculose-1-phosphate aldolase
VTEDELRDQLVRFGEALYRRGMAPGSSGNMSVRLPDGWLVTPTDTCLGMMDPERVARLDRHGVPRSGEAPSKETFLHLVVYEERPSTQAVVHLHSACAVAVSCLADIDPENALPPITAYYVMRVGRLPLAPYYPPGDRGLAEAVRPLMRGSHAALLANHGSLAAGRSLEEAVYAAEEIEETARLFLLLRGSKVRVLTESERAALRPGAP